MIQLLKQRKRRLTHQLENALLGVLGSNLQATRCVVQNNLAEIVRPVEQIVADTTTDIGVLNPLEGANLLV